MKLKPLYSCDTSLFEDEGWALVKCKALDSGGSKTNLLVSHRDARCCDDPKTLEEVYAQYIEHPGMKECVCPGCGKAAPDSVKGLWYLGAFDTVAKEKI